MYFFLSCHVASELGIYHGFAIAISVPISLMAKTRWKIQSVTDVPLRNCYCEFCQTYALNVLWTHYHDIDEGALCYSLFTTLVKSVFLLCGAFLSNSICFVVYNRLSRCLVARLTHGSKVLYLSRTFLVCCK